jgi:hypothetical protein
METWLKENWIWLAILIGTELLPFLPVKANGYVQAVINILSKIKTKGAAALVILTCVYFLTGCTSIQVQPPALSAGGTYTVHIEANKSIPFTASDNTVPVSAVP